jgi:hypothetical protein
MKLKLDLFGSNCNEYPILSVLHNENTVYSGHIVEKCVVEIDLELKEYNTITLAGINKSNGENQKWDTVVDNNYNIIQDKYLVVNDISIDDIFMGIEWVKALRFESVTDTDNNVFSGWWQNGSVTFEIKLPLLDWIIQEKFIRAELIQNINLNDRSGESRFDYKYIQNKIHAIKNIISD